MLYLDCSQIANPGLQFASNNLWATLQASDEVSFGILHYTQVKSSHALLVKVDEEPGEMDNSSTNDTAAAIDLSIDTSHSGIVSTMLKPSRVYLLTPSY